MNLDIETSFNWHIKHNFEKWKYDSMQFIYLMISSIWSKIKNTKKKYIYSSRVSLLLTMNFKTLEAI